MIYFLRDKKNRTILDCEVYEKDGRPEICSTIIITPYSDYLLSHSRQSDVIQTFDRLSQLRGWLWEKAEMEGITDIKQIREAIEADIKAVAKRLPDLHFVTD